MISMAKLIMSNLMNILIEASDAQKIILMTYHSSKGLDFDNVFLPMLDEGNIWFPSDKYNEEKLKTLFMVAMTRSKKNLYLSYIYNLNPLLSNLSDSCRSIYISEILTPETSLSSNPFNFDF